MDDLVNQVCQKTGISQDQAQQAVQTVMGFLKDRLPAPIASQLDNVLSGQGGAGGAGGIAGQAGQALGGMFGGGNNPNPNS